MLDNSPPGDYIDRSAHCERLSAQDHSFLMLESETSPMHIACLAILESGPLENRHGGIDIDRYCATVDNILPAIPRYRQKLAWIPVDRWPVWVDDPQFDLHDHIHHLSLPRPGSEEQLRDVVSRILAQPLDRTRPLWEIWLIEGLDEGRQFAILNKVHHCMADGVAGAELTQLLFSPSAETPDLEPSPFAPRSVPDPVQLLAEAMQHRLAQPRLALEAVRKWLLDDDTDVSRDVQRGASSLRELMGWWSQPASDTPLNGDLGAHRRFEWSAIPLDEVRALRRVLGCTINDIVLATVTGALRRYFERRDIDPSSLDFRIAAPVNIRRSEQRDELGNHVSSWIVRLPLDLSNPLDHVDAIGKRTRELKDSSASLGIESMMAAAEWIPSPLLERGMGLVRGPINMIVTNVPGPQFPLYAAGAKLLGLYPVVPLVEGGGLGIALFSYEGKLCWGFNSDSDLVPDLPAFVRDVGHAFEDLHRDTQRLRDDKDELDSKGEGDLEKKRLVEAD